MSQSEDPEEKQKRDRFSHLMRIPSPSNVVGWSIAGVAGSAISLFFLTGLATSPWLFLLYPVLIAVMLFSLGALGLHFLRHL